MRPIRLEVQGFGVFREHTEIDFESVDLFALVGSTGSGKSTVIDAMCFALYGSVPRYGNKGSVSPIVTMGAIEARVSLTFESAGRRYIATRVVRRGKTGASTKEARLELVDGDVLAGSAREIDGAVEALLGLTFDHFTRAVVLPQNEFARFLHDKPRDRQDLLTKLLGYDVYERMMRNARARAAQQETAVTLAEQQLARLADCTPEQVEIHRQWVAEYGDLRKQIRAARDSLTLLEGEAAAAEEEAGREREVVTRLKQVKVPAKFERLAADRERGRAAVTKAEDASAAAAAAVKTAQVALEELGSRDPLLAAQRAHAELTRVRSALVDAVTQAKESEAAVAPAARQLTEAEAALEALRVAHVAHDLVGALVVGEPCPVCDQPVARVPKRKAPGAGAAARKRVETTQRSERAARDAAAKATQSVTELEGRERELSSQVAEHPDLAGVERRLAAHAAAATSLAAAQRAESATRQQEGEARRAGQAADETLQRAAEAFRTQRDALVQVRAEPPAERSDLAADWPALAAWAAEEVPAREAAAKQADTKAKEVRTARDQRLSALLARAGDLEVEVSKRATTDDLAEAVMQAEHAAKTDLERTQQGIKERKHLDAEIRKSGAEVHVAKELGRLLDARNFERWLVAEALELLIVGASARLTELSAGQYSFAFEETSRDFQVVDHRNANERRSVRTLSGGETFQASLALALALADQLVDLAADGAAGLESIFLDEGFGSLDADTLETVAGTIENLGAGDRMVGVITHVRELADRMPVQYRVTKGPHTATVEQVSR